MIKKTITYKDYNDVERTEEFYFHFSESEILDMEFSMDGGFAERVQKMIDTKDQRALLQIIKKFVIDAFGVKSADGKRFIKNDEVKSEFVECPAYSMIFMELVADDEKAAEFVNGVIPANMKAKFAEIVSQRK